MNQERSTSEEARRPVGLSQLRYALTVLPGRLAALSRERAAAKPAPTAWSPKEELGHLIDSAANNHQRIVRAQLEDNLELPGYDGDRWVAVHAYQNREWTDLIELWKALNEQLVSAAEAAPDSAWSHKLSVGGSEPMTLRFVLDDYVAHMASHLRHLGMDVDDIKAAAASDSPATYPE